MGDKITTVAEQRHIEPGKLKRSLAGDLDWIVMRALEKDRSRRYDTVNGFALDIQRHLNKEPVSAGPPSMHYRITKFVSRNRRGVAAAAALLLTLLAGAGVSVWQAIRATLAQRQAEQSRGSGEKLVAFMLDDLSKALAPVGRLDLMQGVGTEVLRHYKELELQGNSPESGLRHGQALTILALVAESTGRAADADRLCAESITLINKWITQNGRRPEGLKALAEACAQQGRFLMNERWGRKPKPEQIEAALMEAVKVQREVCALPSASNDDRIALAKTLRDLVRVIPNPRRHDFIVEAAKAVDDVERSGSSPPAAKLFKALLIHEAYWSDVPRQDLPDGWVKDDRGMRGSAAWKLAMEVYETFPNDIDLKLGLAEVFKGYWKSVKYDPEGGGTALAAKIADDLVKLDPNNQLWAEKAAFIRLNLASALAHTRGGEDAAPQYQQAIVALEALIQKQPANIALRELLCSAYRTQGFRLLGHREAARQSFSQALKILNEMQKLGYSEEAEEEQIWLNIHMSQVMPTVDEQLKLLRDITPLVERRAAVLPEKDKQAASYYVMGNSQLASYYIHGEAVRYLETARRYSEALVESNESIEAIQRTRQRMHDESYMQWLWREAHQNRSRILSALGRDAEALADIEVAIRIEADALRNHGPGEDYTRLSKMNSLLQAISHRLRLKPVPDVAEFKEIIVQLQMVTDGFTNTESADSETRKTLDYFLGLADNAATLAAGPDLEMFKDQIWKLLIKAHEAAEAPMPAESQPRLNVRKHMARLLIEDSFFMSNARKQGTLAGLLQVETSYWQNRCAQHASECDAWLYLGRYLQASSKLTQMDPSTIRTALQKATELALGSKNDLQDERIDALKQLAMLWTDLYDTDQSMLVAREWIRCSALKQGADDYSTASAISVFIGNLRRLGRASDALVLSEELLALRRRINGSESHEVAVSLRETGSFHVQMKSYDQGRKLIEESISVCRKLGEPELADLASAQIELGRLERVTGNVAGAIQQMTEALALRKKVYPAESAEVTNLTAELSTVMWNSDTYKPEALRLREELLEFGRGHPGSTSWGDWTYEYAGWQKGLKDFPKAEASAREALELQRKSHASGHQPLMAERLLGGILDAEGKNSEAEPHLLTAFEGFVKLAPVLPTSQRSELASSMNYLIDHFKISPGPPDQLAKWAARAQELLLDDKNETASIPADALSRLASLWSELGQHDKAVEIWRRHVEIVRKHASGEPAGLVSALIEYGRELNRDKQLKEAYSAYQEAIELRRKMPGSPVGSLDGYLHEAGIIAGSLKRYDEAIRLLQESLEIRKSADAPNFLLMAAVEQMLGNVFRDKGDRSTAVAHYRQAVEIREKQQGPDHADLAGALKDLSGVLWTLNQHADALKTRARAIQVQKSSPSGLDSGWFYHLHEFCVWLYHEKRFPECETSAQEALALVIKRRPGGWEEYRACGMLGLALIMLKQFEEAETQLLKSYEGLLQQEATIPANERYLTSVTVDRLIQLYTEWGKPDKQAEWAEIKKARAVAKPKP
ncbi:MAG: tetratricopeptide repeat protein [Verrucomicrobiaceae bacterium]